MTDPSEFDGRMREKVSVVVVQKQVDEWRQRGEVDGIEITATFVLKVFPAYLGLPPEGRHHLLKFGEAIFDATGPDNERAITSMAQANESFDGSKLSAAVRP